MQHCQACDRDVGTIRKRNWLAVAFVALITVVPVFPAAVFWAAGLDTAVIIGIVMIAFQVIWLISLLTGTKVCGICRSDFPEH